MSELQMWAIRAEVAFWALLILASIADGWWVFVFAAGALVIAWKSRRIDRAMRGEPPRPGFWSRVWRR